MGNHSTFSMKRVLQRWEREGERQERVYPAKRQAHPNAIHGLPITPIRELRKLKGASFCCSYWRPEQLETAISLLGPDSVLLLDNGAYSAWNAGITLDEAYWDGYWEWALNIIDRVDQAVAVIPDVIDGDEFKNGRMVSEAVGLHYFSTERFMPVWHLHESLDYLDYLVSGGWGHIAFGSSGEYATVGTHAWRARITEAFDAVERGIEEYAHARPRIHMMRGLGQLAFGEFPFATADSTNVARNHSARRGVGEDITAFRERLERFTFPAPAGAFWPRHSYDPAPKCKPAPRQAELFRLG